ncbi:phage replisome organizer N-terminal domain-containing protein [Streptococcus anginosus]|uniref:phage replisome organizer N-terminal domain-containing protein n=1 Tax=Streptococcus anginosus TaxID=1328 RepID=UPI0030101D19
MANVNKRYYWIQLAQDFFKSKEMKLLRKIAGGDTHTIIYLKMMLISLEDNGIIYFDGVADNLAEEIALLIDEDVENIKITLVFLQSKGLLTKVSDREYFLEQVPEMVGSETASTRRSRKHREVKALQCNTDATKRNGDIEIDTEKDKDIKKDINKDKQNFVQEVEANLGRGLVKFEFDMINDYLLNQKVSTKLFLEAVKIAVANNVRKFNYIARILDNWINQGIKTPEQAFQAQRDFQARKNNKAMSANQKTGGNNPEWSNPDYKNETSPEKQAELERQKQELLKKMEK